MPGIPAIAPYPLPGSLEAPAPVVGWTVDPARAVLLVHDMQRFFLRPFPEEVRGPLVDNVATLRARAARLGVPVAYTQQPGGMSPDERGLLADLWGPGMSADPADRAVVDELAPRPGDWTFTKWRYSAFCRSDLRQRMVAAGRDQLVVAGVYAHVGVLMTAVDAFQFDVQPFLVADAIADFTPAAHQQALDYAARCCAVVTTTAEVFS